MATRAYDASRAEVSEQTVYKLGQITFIPHYKEAGLFVGPGYTRQSPDNSYRPRRPDVGREYLPSELLAMGAKKTTHVLWSRAHG